MNGVSNILQSLETYLIDPAILVLFAAGFFMFILGMFQFLWKVSQGQDSDDGKKHMIWGVVGMFIMVSVFGIIALIDNTFGFNSGNPNLGALNNVTAPTNFFTQ